MVFAAGGVAERGMVRAVELEGIIEIRSFFGRRIAGGAAGVVDRIRGKLCGTAAGSGGGIVALWLVKILGEKDATH